VSPGGRPSRRALVIGGLLLLLALVRGGWTWWVTGHDPDAVRSADTASYEVAAESLRQEGRFLEDRDPDLPMFLRTPGYPTFLAVAEATTGGWRGALLVQVGASVALVAATGLLAARLLRSSRAGWVAGAVVAVDPLQNVAAGTLLTESVASATLVAVVAGGVAVVRTPVDSLRWWHTAGWGATVAVATLVRPTTYYLPVAFVLLLVLRVRRTGWRRTALQVGAFVLPLLVAIGGWQLRNTQVVGSSRYSAIEAVNLLCYRGASAEARGTGEDLGELREGYGCPHDRPLESWCPTPADCDPTRPRTLGPRFDRMAETGTQLILEHPVPALADWAAGMGRLLLGPGESTLARFLALDALPRWATLGLAGWAIGTLGLAALGTVLVLRSPDRWSWSVVLVTLAYVVVVSGGPEAYARFRTPLVPLLALLIAAALGRRVGGVPPAVEDLSGAGAPRAASGAPGDPASST